MDIPLETLMLIAIVIIAAVVGVLELKYLRSRKQVKLDVAIERDDAYNAVSTTRAVADSLRQNGRDTSEADILIYKAENAYDRREFLNAIELAGKARTMLMSCKEKDLISMPPSAPTKGENVEVPSNHVRKMPANYLESKFMIDSVRCLVPDASDEVKEEAAGCLDRAQTCFENEDYSEALSEAMRAKRMLTPSTPVPEKSYPSTVVKLGPTGKAPPVAEGPKISPSCPSCHAEISSDDVFCRKCGARLDG
jgi:hypothetical protein